MRHPGGGVIPRLGGNSRPTELPLIVPTRRFTPVCTNRVHSNIFELEIYLFRKRRSGDSSHSPLCAVLSRVGDRGPTSTVGDRIDRVWYLGARLVQLSGTNNRQFTGAERLSMVACTLTVTW